MVPCTPDIFHPSLMCREKQTPQYRSQIYAPKGEKYVEFAVTMACPEAFQENIGWPTEVRIGFVHFRRFRSFGLQFTPLWWMSFL